MVIMASSIALGRVRTTTTATESRNMAAKHQIYQSCSLGLPSTSLMLDIHDMLNWHVSIQGIRWPVLRGYIAGSSWELIEVSCFLEVDRWPSAGFSIGSRTHVGLTCFKQGQVVYNASPGLKVNRSIPWLLLLLFLIYLFIHIHTLITILKRLLTLFTVLHYFF